MKRKQYTQVENRAQKYYIFLKKKRGGRKKRGGLQIGQWPCNPLKKNARRIAGTIKKFFTYYKL
ncbi:MAG: hypothetical protein II899_12550 [Bacteroidales bacterium]|nr:hypothetical protein [Bacteroidales bacterium]